MANLLKQISTCGIAATLATVFLAAGAALAKPASPWAANEYARLRLISAADSTGKAETLSFGLEFRMAPQWKIYWRAPGDAGYPPQIDWRGSSNLAGVEIGWPVPRRYSIFGLTTYVYQDTVVLPLTVRPQVAGEPLALRAHVNYLLCDKICIPYEADLDLTLPAGAANPTDFSHLIDRFHAKVPHKVAGGDGAVGLSIERTLLTPDGDGAVLEVLARSAVPFGKPDLLVEGPPQMAFDAPLVELSDGDRLALLRVPVGLVGAKTALPPAPPVTLTLIDGARAIEQDVTLTTSDSRDESPLLGILTLALLGGLILNLMPCVLPVLSLKLMNAVAQAGRSSAAVRASFLATAAGIVTSILALAGAVIALKSAGLAVGWGVQFQQPAFLALMALILVLFACNLWGLFHIPLPQALGDAAVRHPPRRGLSGDFATGMFATLLATPCSAPFLGTAVGFALTRGWREILLVFATLGLGLALPYLAVAAAPRLARLLPRPGHWMGALRRILAVLLAATAMWLISVLAVQVSWPVALATAALLAAIILVLVLRRRLGVPARSAGLAAVVGLALAVMAVPLYFSLAPRAELRQAGDAARLWQPFDRVQLFNAVGQGKVVLVDVTADWCITCQANKALVLDRGEVRRRIERGEILALRADWTRPSAAIADYLAGFGRYGIPFNAVYGPGAPTGIALPELLRAEDVLAAVAKAAGEQQGTARAGS